MTHILDEARSPPESLVWVMWCGASCFMLDGDAGVPTAPFLDFYAQRWGHRASCPGCRERRGLPAIRREVATA